MKKAIDFGKYVNEKAFNRYVEESNTDSFEDDDIVDIFIEFTKQQQKETLKTKDYVEAWIDEWMDLFPRGVKSGGKLLRSDKKACLKKLIDFVNETKYDQDTIMQATKDYLFERSLENYAYTKCATYFISKVGEGSELGACCEKLLDDKQKGNEKIIFESDELI